MNLPPDIEISGPFTEYSSPYGKVLEGLNRDVWYVSRKLKESEQDTEIRKLLKSKSLGVIARYQRHKNRYIIDQLYPVVTFSSLKKSVDYLIANEGKLIFCT